MKSSSTQRSFLIKAGLIVGGGGLIFGYDIGVISGTLKQLADEFDLDNFQQGLVVSILYGGALLGCVVGGPLCDYLGRVKTIHIQNLIFIIGAAVTGLAPNLSTLCAGRFIVGIASAISGIADVPYLTEISPPEYRGLLSSQYEILVCVGILLSFTGDLLFASFPQGWRIAFLIPSAMAILQSIGMCFLPESPRWLMEKGLLDEAKVALSEIYGTQHLLYEIDSAFDMSRSSHKEGQYNALSQQQRDRETLQNLPQDLIDYQQAIEVRDRLQHNKHNPNSTINSKVLNSYDSDIFDVGCLDNSHTNDDNVVTLNFHKKYTTTSTTTTTNKHSINNNDNNTNNTTQLNDMSPDTGLSVTATEQQVFKEFTFSIYLIIIIQIIAQITGSNVIRNYAPTIFEHAGVSSTMSLVYNVILGAVKLLFTIISVLYIDTTGRLSLLTYGIILVAIGMLFLTLASAVSTNGQLHSPAIYMIGCALVYGGFGFGYGPIPWLLSSELFPTVIRGRVMSISLIASNVAQLVTNMLFLVMDDYLSTSGTFGLFFLLNICTFIFVRIYLVETKEISPADILTLLRTNYVFVHKRMYNIFCCCCAEKPYVALLQSTLSSNTLGSDSMHTSTNKTDLQYTPVSDGMQDSQISMHIPLTNNSSSLHASSSNNDGHSCSHNDVTYNILNSEGGDEDVERD